MEHYSLLAKTSQAHAEGREANTPFQLSRQFPLAQLQLHKPVRKGQIVSIQDPELYPPVDYPHVRAQTCRMTNAYLLKTEPTEYSFTDLQKDKKTVWDGVHNPVALRNLGAMKPGDKIIIYETGDTKSAVGTGSVVSVKDSNPKNPQIEIAAGKFLAKPVSLAEIKANKIFASSPLVRMARLSVVPLTAEQYKFLAD